MKKITNLKELEIWTDIHFLSSIIKKQIDKKKTDNLIKMADAVTNLAFYFQEYTNNIRLYEKALSEYKLAKNRAIQRARRSEQETEKIQRKINSHSY